MKKNLTKKLMLSVLTLAFAVVSLGASTFAWFTMSENAEVQQFEASVKAAAGVEIAVTPSSVTTLTKDQANALRWYSGVLPKVAIEDYCDVQFDALTTTDLDAFFKLDPTNVELKTVDNAAEKSYIEFNLWFRTSTSDVLCLTKLDLATKGTPNEYPIDAGFILANDLEAEVGDKATFEVASAARISLNTLVYQAEEAPGSKTGTSIVAGNSTKKPDNYAGKGAIAYYIAKYEASYGASDKSLSTLPINALDATEEDTVSDTAAVDLVTFTGDINAPQLVKVKVWIEGWDAECLNAIFSQTLTVDIEFTLKSALN